MTEKSMDLPQECWELIFNSLDHDRHFESLSLVCTRFLSITDQLRRSLTVSLLSVPVLPRLFHRYPNLKNIEFREFFGDHNSVLEQISQTGLDLESLDVSGGSCFPLMGLRVLGLTMRNLRKFKCSRIWGLQDTDLFAIGSSFPLLEELDISFPQYNSQFNPDESGNLESFSAVVTDAGILDLSMKLKELCRINLSGNHFITDKSLLFLSSNCLLLKEVVIFCCDFITQNGIGLVMRNTVNLSSIKLDGIGIPSMDSFLQKSVVYAKALSELELSNSFLSDEFLILVAEAQLSLKKLTISNCYNFSSVGISFLLSRCQYLVYLDLEGTGFLKDKTVIELSKFLSNLTYINLSLCPMLTSLTFFSIIKNCPWLKEIKMERTNLGLEEFAIDFVINLQVKSLNFVCCSSLNDEFMKKVTFCCPNIEVLEVGYCLTISEEGIREVLSCCNKIRHLDIRRCVRVTNFNLECELPKLEVLDAQGPGIDDEALAIIGKRCPGLLHLDLEGCLNVTEKGVNEIVRNCRRLRDVNLRRCDNVHPDFVARMVFLRPSLRKIIPPCGFIPTDKQSSIFMRHGCLVCNYPVS